MATSWLLQGGGGKLDERPSTHLRGAAVAEDPFERAAKVDHPLAAKGRQREGHLAGGLVFEDLVLRKVPACACKARANKAAMWAR